MSTAAHDDYDVEKGGSDPDLSGTQTSQSEAKAEQQDPIFMGPYHTNSMLARRRTLPIGGKDGKDGLLRRLWGFRRAGPVKMPTPAQQQDDGAPVGRDTASIECDKDSILRVICSERSCSSAGSNRPKTVKMPQFDSLSAYLPAGRDPKELWREEAARLVAEAKSPEPNLDFSSIKRFMSEGTEEGYQDLARLAETVLSALSLCLLDNECINVEYCKQLANRDRLKKLIQQARVSQTNSEWDEGGVGGDHADRVEDDSLDAIYALIDYISALLAKLLSQMATGKYWTDNILAVLTQRVTKLKVLLLDMHANTLISCQAGEAALDRQGISTRLSNGILDEEECDEVLRMIDAEAKEGLTTASNADVARYCVDQNRFRSGIDLTLRYLLLSLRFQNRSGLDCTSFEMCGMVYATGFENFKVLLFQDRDLEYSASSDQDTLNTAYPAFKILDQALQRVGEKTGAKPPKGALRTTVEWRYREAAQNGNLPASTADDLDDLSRCPTRRAVMESMSDIIAVMIPLILTSPSAVASLTKYRTVVALTCESKDMVRPFKPKDYCAFIRLYTNRFEADSKSWNVMRLSAAVQAGVFSRLSLIAGGQPSGDAGKIASKLADRMQEMEGWVVDEGGVTVTCQFQVCQIVVVAFLLAGGGLCIMAVGEGITGVDPSNLSMYLWVLAGFYLLVCKSRFVENWPWSDFLHFRVRCRSVSELHAISGIDEQCIMAKLLHDERGGSVLTTRGPYNKAFLNQSSGDGFSIDCPLHMKTLLLSGLIMLKVVTPRGHALVCLDARRGSELMIVEHQGNQAQEHLICEDINRLQEQHGRRMKAPDGIRLQLAVSKSAKWNRVQGVYKDMQAEFV
ncbi:hypothetical protein QBC40DRAFT_164201 [Triangularia verruculosa]|uniref:Uncharacterized protein n=1 Tax=Triangularia verruculosa TaxID=2587418 RepID=A0AAN6XQR3_9PEZI|nr:hypothetical protein QBC40DRAFT_164201 [Triangularia verruculosa]